MTGHAKQYLVSLAVLAMLGGFLGGMGSYWYFFWKNREMCPCAPQGIAGGENLESQVAEPYSDEIMRTRVATFSLVGVLLGTAAGLALSVPGARRMQRIMSEIEKDRIEGS